MRVKVIVISGSMGSGKTTVLGEASDILSERGVVHATLDLNAIGTVLLPEESAKDLTVRNLEVVFSNFVVAGIRHVLLATAVESHDHLQALRSALSEPELVVCRLTAAVDTMQCRLRIREPGMHQERFIARSQSLNETLSAAEVEDFTTANDGRNVTDVAHEVLRRAGWIL